MTIEQKKQWITEFLGEAFVKGVSIKGDVARVIVVGEGGIHKEVKISLPKK